MSDWVAIGSYLTVAISAVIVIFLGFKVNSLMNKDSKK